ncbi:odorant receptor coreceptor-like [Prorops nasuta]|uniref:odorant receptor coreceptor-like n=1 Tax=Prorops nasuta TaxID=863751 RepID=UPI0034CD6984
MAYIIVSILVTFMLLVSNATIFIVFLQHVCGMYAVIGYRLEHAFCNKKKCKNCIPTTYTAYDTVVLCIRRHLNTIRFLSAIAHIFQLVCLLVAMGSILLAATVILSPKNFRATSFVLATLSVLFFPSLAGQRLINANMMIIEKAYNSKWYNQPAWIQKLLIIIFLRCQQQKPLGLYYFYTLTLKDFGVIVKMIISYYMMIRDLY